MTEPSLSDELEATLRQVEDLAQRHRAAESYATALSRTAYLHDLARRLADELAGLRRAAAAAESVGGGETARLWRATCAALRASEPAALRSPAQALALGDLELLRLVEYTGAAIALVRERRAALEGASSGAPD